MFACVAAAADVRVQPDGVLGGAGGRYGPYRQDTHTRRRPNGYTPAGPHLLGVKGRRPEYC